MVLLRLPNAQGFVMILGGIEFVEFAQLRLVLEKPFGNDPLEDMK